MTDALSQVKQAAEDYDRALVEKRDAFYEAVREAAKTCTYAEIAEQCGRTVSRVGQIVDRKPHSRRRVVQSEQPLVERKKRVGVEVYVA